MTSTYAAPTQADVDRFWSKVDRTPGCWLWTGARFRSGYGAFGKYGEAFYAHRIAYELTFGPIPNDQQVDHLCNVRECVNPRHLQLVTHAENVRRGYVRRRANDHPIGWYSRALYCKNGHYKTARTVRITTLGRVTCKVCANASARAKRLAVKEARLGQAA